MKIIISSIVFVAVGLFLGRMMFGNTAGNKNEAAKQVQTVQNENIYWTCSMHPQIHSSEEGDCPLCGMDLIPVENGVNSLPDNQIMIGSDEINNAGIKTIKVSERKISKTVSLQGYSVIDHSSMKDQPVHFNGRITKAFVNFSGQKVKKNDIIATIYSPELVTAQKEFLEVLKMNSGSDAIYNSSKRKLELLNISENDISLIEKNKKVTEFFNIRSDHDGYVDKINAFEGDYVIKGKNLYSLYSTDKIWFEFEIYEDDRAFVHEGDSAEIVISNKGHKFRSTVDFIYPLTRTSSASSSVRVVVNNKNNNLRAGLYADAVIYSELENKRLAVPKSSILWTGRRSVAFVKVDPNIFEMRNVTLGEESGDLYIIENGLKPGDEIVFRSLFTLDAAAQLQGKSSMMNNTAGQ
ncbi:MAG: efflux RND transporter periplasmic adaptor subunit [Candidatus Delongbacteria bacterium]|nr:efflux RND transporter periplasmic adaptor subunit [Candidatus Delongbacteria bacterium]